jgi:hypothetical protein
MLTKHLDYHQSRNPQLMAVTPIAGLTRKAHLRGGIGATVDSFTLNIHADAAEPGSPFYPASTA